MQRRADLKKKAQYRIYVLRLCSDTDEKKPPLVTEVLSTEGAAYLLRILFCPDGVSAES